MLGCWYSEEHQAFEKSSLSLFLRLSKFHIHVTVVLVLFQCCLSGGKGTQRAARADVQTAEHSVQSAHEWYRLPAGRAPRQSDIP